MKTVVLAFKASDLPQTVPVTIGPGFAIFGAPRAWDLARWPFRPWSQSRMLCIRPYDDRERCPECFDALVRRRNDRQV